MSSKVLVIYTGGTVGMHKDPESGALKPLDFDGLRKHIPELQLLPCEIDSISFNDPIDSSNMSASEWIELATIIEENYHQYDGFVILHGSDTMAYTSSALSFMLENLEKPVILTGSQLPIGILRSDAKENLINSIEIAALKDKNDESLIQEVAVYFEYKLYRGNRVFKNSSENFEAFESLNYPALAEAGVNMKINHRFLNKGTNGVFRAHKKMNTNVAVVQLFPGFNAKIFNAVVETGVEGIILLSFGAGNTPTNSELFSSIKKAQEKGMKIANITQCRAGGVSPGMYEAGRGLKDLGVLNGKDMTLEAGLTKMMFLLELKLSEKAFIKHYSDSLKGELTNG